MRQTMVNCYRMLAAATLAATAGCAGALPGGAAPSITPTASVLPTPTVEQKFVVDVLSTPGLTSTMSNGDLIALGKKMCEAIPEASSHTVLIGQLGTSKLGSHVSDVILTAAEDNLCPYAIYGKPNVVDQPVTPGPTSTMVADQPAQVAEPSSNPGSKPADAYQSTQPTEPSTSFNDGTYEVGVDIVAGKYKSAGGTDCYWARLRDPSSTNIIANDLGSGPRTVILRKGEYFTTQRCGTWTKAP